LAKPRRSVTRTARVTDPLAIQQEDGSIVPAQSTGDRCTDDAGTDDHDIDAPTDPRPS